MFSLKRKRRAPEPEVVTPVKRCFCGDPVRKGADRCARHLGAVFGGDVETRA